MFSCEFYYLEKVYSPCISCFRQGFLWQVRLVSLTGLYQSAVKSDVFNKDIAEMDIVALSYVTNTAIFFGVQ